MDQKMKNFDRSIEQMMNENAVTPPFGMWNRISSQLDAEAVVASTAAATAPAQRSTAGMVVSALVIGASFVTAYFVNSNSLQQQPVPATKQIATPTVIAPVVTTLPVAEQIVVAEKPAVKHAAVAIRSSKPKTIAKPVEESITPAEQTATVSSTSSLPGDVEVLVPLMAIDNNTTTTDTYYFPAVDMYTGESKAATARPVAKAATKSESSEREVSSSSAPRIKFRPQRHSKHSYGKINRTNSRRR